MMTSPLRVLFLIGGGGFGGLERHVQCLIANIDRSSVQPHLCVVLKAGEISNAIAASGVPTHVIGASSGHSPIILKKMLYILRENKIDLVHAHHLPFLAGVVLFFQPRIPLICSIHCLEKIVKNKPWPIQLLEWCWQRIIECRVNKWLPVSLATLVRQSRRIKYKGEVFFNPIQLSAEKKNKAWLSAEINAPVGVPLVGMVGRMADQKDWPAFLSICKGIADVLDDVHFVAVGDGPKLSDFKKSPASVSLGRRLHWMGFRDDARQIIAALDVFLLTSKHEELPTTLLEAMVGKTPIVGFLPIGGTEEVLKCAEGEEQIALLNKERNIEQVAGDVVNLLAKTEKGHSMAERAYKTIETNFEAHAACRRLVSIYRTVIHG